MESMIDTVTFVVKVVALGCVVCAVFEFVMWRLFRAKVEPPEEKK